MEDLRLTSIAVAKGYVVLPKSVTPSRITANLKGTIAAYKALSKEDIEKLDSVAASGKQKRFIMPPWRKCFRRCTMHASNNYSSQLSTWASGIGQDTRP